MRLRVLLLLGAAALAYMVTRRPAAFDDGWSDLTDGDWYD